MDRQSQDYAAASAMAAYAQQQRQATNLQQQQPFGFHGQHQQFPPSVPGPPFLPPHPAMQQYPYHHPMQQQPQLHPHHPPHPHLLHLQQQQQPPPAFASHLPPPMVPSPFHGPYDSAPPPPVPPPSDPELQKRIDKLVEYIIKNGPEFESMIREKQQDNPAYGFLFGGEGQSYYRYKLWLMTRPHLGGPFNSPFPSSSMPMLHPHPNPMTSPSPLNAPPLNASASIIGGPQMHQTPFASFYEQQHHQQAFGIPGRSDYDQSSKSFKGLSGPLPSDVALELNNVLNNLTGAKESIKGAKTWFMQRSPFAPAMAEALRDMIFNIDDSEKQLHIIYLVNDILFESMMRRINSNDLDNEALAFEPVLGSMLARVYHNPQMKEESQLKLQKLVQFWASKEIYDQDTINRLEGEMINGVPTKALSGHPKELPAAADVAAGLTQHTNNHTVHQWQPDRQGAIPSFPDQEHSEKAVPSGQALPRSMTPQQFLPSAIPTAAFVSSIPLPTSVQPPNQQPNAQLMPPQPAAVGEKLPPYPLFPPGLIPGMVRKMQIGSGVPYSPMSPLDIPTIIPPSNISPSEVLERVSKFFKEIGEVNPSEGPMSSDAKDEDFEYEREAPVRKGGACIPPPPNLQVDPETGAYADGSVDRKGLGRLGLGATANPNEDSQYDDVYTSYRKQRSTNYHSSMSARATTK